MTNLNTIARIAKDFATLDHHAKAFVLRELNGNGSPLPAPPANGVVRAKGKWSKGAKTGLALRRYWSKMTPKERQNELARRMLMRAKA